MAENQTVRECLVRLGYRIDGESGKHFERSIEAAASKAMGLGMADHLLLDMRSGRFGKYVSQFQAMAQGAKLNQAARHPHRLAVELNRVTSQFHLKAAEAAAAIQKAVDPEIEQFAKRLQQNRPEIACGTGQWPEPLPGWAKGITRFFEAAERAAAGWPAKRSDFAGALNVLSMSPFGKIAGGLRLLPPVCAGYSGWKAGPRLHKHEIKGRSPDGKISSLIAQGLSFFGDKTAAQAIRDMHGGGTPRSRQDVAPRLFMPEGWTKAQAGGIVAHLLRESGFNPHATDDHGKGYGIAQRYPAPQARFRKWAKIPLSRASVGKQLAFLRCELTHGRSRAALMLRADANALAAGADFPRYYEPPAATRREAAQRGELTQHISATTTINVHGVSNPDEVAKEVQSAQHDVNSSLVRNMKALAQ